MSGSGDPWDPNRPGGSYYNPFPDGAAMAGSGIHLSPTSRPKRINRAIRIPRDWLRM